MIRDAGLFRGSTVSNEGTIIGPSKGFDEGTGGFKDFVAPSA